VLSNSSGGLGALVYYVVTYGLTVVGAFGVAAVVENATGGAKLTDFAGLSRRAPGVSICMMVFLLSLAGIPPLAGFFGKFYVFVAAAGAVKDLGLLWLVILAIALSAVSLYYYLQVLKQIWVLPAPENAPRIKVPLLATITLAVLAAGVLVLGAFPAVLLNAIHAVGPMAGR
jgi:NADH-quinone oxidoreductase subunit N